MTANRSNSAPNPFRSRRWAVRVPEVARRQLSAFRTWPDLVACNTPHGLWVRSESSGEACTGELIRRLRVEAVAELFEVTSSKELIPLDCRVPTDRLPEGPWIPLSKLLSVVWPMAGFAAEKPSGCPLKLVRSDQEIEPTWLELELTTWANLVVVTPEIRLARWEFAASGEGRVLIRGLPLPSVNGQRFYEREGVLIPVGYRWLPAVTPGVIRRLMPLSPEDLMLWRADTNRWERIPKDSLVPARRANVRQTVIELSSSRGEQI